MTSSSSESGGGATRREALKLAGAATLGGMAASLAAGAPAGASLSAAAISGHRFSMEIDGVLVAGVHEIDVISSVSDVSFVPDSTGQMIPQPGQVTDQSITVVKDWSNTGEWYNWRKTVLDGKVDRKTVTVIILSDVGAEVGRYVFKRAWPAKYRGASLNARNSGHATESLEIAYETVQFQK